MLLFFNASQSLAIKVAPLGSAHVETSSEDTSLFFGNKEIVAFVSYVRHIIIPHPGNIKLK